jgi:enamine deaminase RidA (YjgF/YER057c/UK114 family)
MKIMRSLTCCVVLLSTPVLAQDRKVLNPPELPPASGYSHVVVAPEGRRVVISGQVALDSRGNLVGQDDFEKQCIQVHENIAKALAALGLTFSDVIRTDNFITDRKYLPLLRKVRGNYLPKDHPPASTLLVVDGLFRPELMVEVSVEAVLPRTQAVAH